MSSAGILNLPITSLPVDNFHDRALWCKSTGINYNMHGWILCRYCATGWFWWISGLRAVTMWSSSSFTKIVAVRSGSSSSRNNSSSSDRTRKPCLFRLPLIASFMGPTWGPPGANRTQVVLISAPWTLLSLVDNVNLIWKMSTVKIAIHDRDTCVRSRYMGVSISNYNPQITVGFNYLPIPYVSTCDTSPQFRKDKNIR